MSFKNSCLVLVLLSSFGLHAQFQISIDAKILDDQTKAPIPFTKIDFPNAPVKVVSDINGRFYCYYDEDMLLPDSKVHFTAKGYQTEKTTVRQLYRLLANSSKIYLKPNNKEINSLVENDLSSKGEIRGTVMHNNEPLSGAVINKKGSLEETVTDNQGRYNINAEVNDVLMANFVGMKPKQLVIKENQSLNILLESDGTKLDEIYLKGQSQKEPLLNLGQGNRKTFDALGTSVNTFTEKDIKDHHTSLTDVLAGKYAGIPPGVSAPGATPVFAMRSVGSISYPANAIYDIDGQIFDTNAPGGMQMPFVDIQNVKSISVLRSLAATNRYGTLGRGGVIVIRTKMMEADAVNPGKSSAIVKGNDYNEVLQQLTPYDVATSYFQELQAANSLNDAKTIFKNRKSQTDQGLTFFIESATYFARGDRAFAIKILDDLIPRVSENIKALRSIAFTYELLNNFVKAQDVYQKIAILRPLAAQSYYDLARLYEINGYYQQSFELYKNIIANTIENVDTRPLQRIASNELRRFLLKHRTQVDYSNMPSDFLSAEFKLDTRIVLEYNDPYAQFSVQFVNPKQKYFEWNHTEFENKTRLLDEIKKGYTIEEYTIENSAQGDWLLNLKTSDAQEDKNPNYLKYTIYKNYGTTNETKLVKLINLNALDKKVKLETLR